MRGTAIEFRMKKQGDLSLVDRFFYLDTSSIKSSRKFHRRTWSSIPTGIKTQKQASENLLLIAHSSCYCPRIE